MRYMNKDIVDEIETLNKKTTLIVVYVDEDNEVMIDEYTEENLISGIIDKYDFYNGCKSYRVINIERQE